VSYHCLWYSNPLKGNGSKHQQEAVVLENPFDFFRKIETRDNIVDSVEKKMDGKCVDPSTSSDNRVIKSPEALK
jgi:hypothetical protein